MMSPRSLMLMRAVLADRLLPELMRQRLCARVACVVDARRAPRAMLMRAKDAHK